MKNKQTSCRLAVRLSIGLLMLLVVCSGCGKKQTPTSSNLTPASNAPAPAVTPAREAAQQAPASHPAPPAPPIAANATADAAAQQLTMELRRYVIYTRKIPKTFDQFIAQHPMQYPPPPTGKHYVIQDGKVVVQ